MAWRQQRRARKQDNRSATNAVRASPWASGQVKNDQFLDVTDVRVQLARISEQKKRLKKQKQPRRRPSSRNHPPRTAPETASDEGIRENRNGMTNLAGSPRPPTIEESVANEDPDESSFVGAVHSPEKEEETEHERSDLKTKPDGAPARRRRRTRPNHFVCVRIAGKEVVDSLVKIQRSLVEIQANAKDLMIDPVGFHITLILLHVESPFEMQKLKEALERAGQIVRDDVLYSQPLQLSVRGFDTFGNNRVLYAGIEYGKELLKEVRNTIVQEIREAGCEELLVNEGQSFVPHITLAKKRKGSSSSLQLVEKLLEDPSTSSSSSSSSLSSLSSEPLGYQDCHKMYLCPIGSSKPGEFYAIEAECSLLSIAHDPQSDAAATPSIESGPRQKQARQHSEKTISNNRRKCGDGQQRSSQQPSRRTNARQLKKTLDMAVRQGKERRAIQVRNRRRTRMPYADLKQRDEAF
eukprot:jgi/Bigna1/127200/aug1.4_g1908